MKPLVIADSSALVSLSSVTDDNHRKATKITQLIKTANVLVVIPGEILTETINVLGKKISHQTAINFADTIFESDKLAIIETTSKTRVNAFKKFKQQPSSVSFTDCLVMAFADEYSTDQIFGFDEVFKKNGYHRIGFDS